MKVRRDGPGELQHGTSCPTSFSQRDRGVRVADDVVECDGDGGHCRREGQRSMVASVTARAPVNFRPGQTFTVTVARHWISGTPVRMPRQSTADGLSGTCLTRPLETDSGQAAEVRRSASTLAHIPRRDHGTLRRAGRPYRWHWVFFLIGTNYTRARPRRADASIVLLGTGSVNVGTTTLCQSRRR